MGYSTQRGEGNATLQRIEKLLQQILKTLTTLAETRKEGSK